MKHAFKSSNHLVGFEYDDSSQQLVVEFQSGAKYRHIGVPPELINGFVKDWSPGKFYHQVVKRYKYNKIEPEKQES